tara:strand:- start:4561 stop:5652 length:1092 start_codon:yes stop_codon:yes gene_type:complete
MVHILGIVLMIFFKKNNLIFIISPKFSGNPEAIYTKYNENNKEVLFLSITFREYKRLKSKKINVFFYLNPIHLAKLFKSKFILATHGVYFINLVKIFSKAKLINIRHGVITLGGYSRKKRKNDFINHTKKFDRYCFLSKQELRIVQDQFSYQFLNNYIFEFPQLEYIENLNLYKQDLKKQMNLENTNQYILIANTDTRQNFDAKNSLFSIHNLSYLTFLNNLVENLNAKIIIKPHWKTKISRSLNEEIKNLKNIIYQIDLIENFDSELKAVADILITDWSTVYIDVLKNINEVIFVNNVYPDSQVIPNEFIENKFIKRKENLQELEEKILISLNLDGQSETVLNLKALFLEPPTKEFNNLTIF